MNIYVTKNGQQLGPYSLDQARSLVSAGTLQPTDLAWYQGLPTWIALQQIPGLGNSSSAPRQRPVLVWIICIFYFVTVLLSLIAISTIFARNTQQQVDQPIDPTERNPLLAQMQKELHDNQVKAARIRANDPRFYLFTIPSLLLKLVAAILLFRLRRPAYYVFAAALIINLIGTAYRFGRDPTAFASGLALFSMMTGWAIAIAIILYVRSLARTGVLTNGPASTASA